MLTSYKTIYVIAGVMLIMAGLLASAPYPTDLSLEMLGCVLFFIAAVKSRHSTPWHIALLAGFSTAVFWLSEFLSDPQFLGLRLPPFNRPIEAGIHPFAGVIAVWGLMILMLVFYEIFFICAYLAKRTHVRESAWALLGIVFQCASLYYISYVVSGI
jgi:hypothetical protein